MSVKTRNTVGKALKPKLTKEMLNSRNGFRYSLYCIYLQCLLSVIIKDRKEPILAQARILFLPISSAVLWHFLGRSVFILVGNVSFVLNLSLTGLI